jgi:hypothetical protein
VSRIVVNVTWTNLVSLALIRQSRSEEGGLQFLGSSGRITVSGDDCSLHILVHQVVA